MVEFGKELLKEGRYAEAAVMFRSVLNRDPRETKAQEGLQHAVDRFFITPEQLIGVKRGASADDVREALGTPPQGWTRTMARGGKEVEAWFYRSRTGGVAGVYFLDGRVFATDPGAAGGSSTPGS